MDFSNASANTNHKMAYYLINIGTFFSNIKIMLGSIIIENI